MDISTQKRQQLIEEINTLPEDSLPELGSFIEYLRYKAAIEQKPEAPQANFLLSVAGLGTLVETDASEHNEAILASEVDLLHGWSLHNDK